MKVITVNRFDRGMSGDRYGGLGEFSIAKHFDILTNPRVLKPKRGMSTHTTSTGIGNLVVAGDGLLYGLGTDGGSPAKNKLWVLPGYGASDDFRACTTNQIASTASANIVYDFLLDWADSGETNGQKICWASNNTLWMSAYDAVGMLSNSGTTLNFSSIGQGLVHPKDKYLYVPYIATATSIPYVAAVSPNASAYGGISATALQLPKKYRSYCLSYFGDYLAVPMTGVSAVSLVSGNIVGLWNRDSTNSLFSETVPWGNGSLQVLNNLQGMLIGVSLHGPGSSGAQADTSQDYNSIQIKGWAGGAEPTLIKEIKVTSVTPASGFPAVSINPRVNFIYNNRLYFSVNVDPNDGIQPARIGLWSVGKNKTTGEWTVNLEHVATNSNSETSIISAVMVGDYVECVHSSAGTLTKSTNGYPTSTTFGATSVYESSINPQMDLDDSMREKNLFTIGVNFEPLRSGASVVLKYRVDSSGSDSDWITVKTFDVDGDTRGEATDAAGETFQAGTRYEFRLESTGGAVITSFSYKYDTTKTNL